MGRIPGSMYRKKMAFVTSLTQQRQRLSRTDMCRMNIQLASRNNNIQGVRPTDRWPSGRNSYSPWTEWMQTNLRWPCPCDGIGHVVYADWPVGIRDTSSPSDFHSFWVPDGYSFRRRYITNSAVQYPETEHVLLCNLFTILTHRASTTPYWAPLQRTLSLFHCFHIMAEK